MNAEEMRHALGEHGRHPIPTAAQVWDMANAAGQPLKNVILVTAYSGLRLFEMAAVEPEHYDPGLHRLFLPKRKRGKPGVIGVFGPGRGAMLDALRDTPEKPLPRTAPKNPVFRTKTGSVWTSETVSAGYRPVRDRLGVPGTFHSLRHFCATWLLNQGASDMDVAVQLGHFDAKGRPNTDLVRSTYGHPDYEEALGRLARLNDGGYVARPANAALSGLPSLLVQP